MSQILELARVFDGRSRNQDLTTAEIVSASIRYGGATGTLLTKAILDTLIAQTHAPLSDNQNVVAGAGLTGGGSTATVTLNVIAGDASLLVSADDLIVQKSTTGAISLAVDGIKVNTDNVTTEINSNNIQVKDLGISTAKILNNAVDNTKLKSDAVTDSNRAVTTDHIRDSAITSDKIATSVAGAGLVGGAGTPLAFNPDNTTIEITIDSANVKDLGISTSKLANNTVTGAKLNDDTAGAGLTRNGTTKALDVVYSPRTQQAVTVGESFSANISYLVRWAVTGETAGRIYKANASLARTQGKHLVYGILLSTSALIAGDSTNVLLTGTHTLGSGDTAFSSGDVGKALYLKNDASGGFSITPPTTVDDAQFRIGIIEETTKISVDIKELDAIVPVPTYDAEIYYPTGLAATTNITLPNHPITGSPQTYIPGSYNLKVFVNSIFKRQGTDWTSIDSSTIQFPIALPNDSRVAFRIDPATSGVLAAGGGGGVGSLQDAYNSGNSITIASGVPVIINGPAGQKLIQVNGDIGCTGILDPTAIQLSPQVSNPFPTGQKGIWLDNSDNLLVKGTAPTSTNITERLTTLEVNSLVIVKSYLNNTGSTIAAFTPVYSPSSGEIAPADGYNASKFRVIGITTMAISPSASGNVAVTGIIIGITGFTHNNLIYVGSTPGSKTDIEPVVPTYTSGFHVIKLGVQEGNNLILQIEQIGVL